MFSKQINLARLWGQGRTCITTVRRMSFGGRTDGPKTNPPMTQGTVQKRSVSPPLRSYTSPGAPRIRCIGRCYMTRCLELTDATESRQSSWCLRERCLRTGSFLWGNRGGAGPRRRSSRRWEGGCRWGERPAEQRSEDGSGRWLWGWRRSRDWSLSFPCIF